MALSALPTDQKFLKHYEQNQNDTLVWSSFLSKSQGSSPFNLEIDS